MPLWSEEDRVDSEVAKAMKEADESGFFSKQSN